VDASRQRLVYGKGELSDSDLPLLDGADQRPGSPPTLHLVPSRDSLRRRVSSSSSTSSATAAAAGPAVVIPRLDFGLITVRDCIGTGSFKSVFQGSYGSHRIACLRFRGGEAATRCAMREAEVMACLPRHPHVLRFFGMTRDPAGCHYLVCEYAEHGALDAAIANRRLPWPLVGEIGGQIASGMAAVVERRLLHRDLSLRNVLCFKLDVPAMTAVVKVGDFGKAINFGTIPRPEEPVPIRWAAPEVLSAHEYSESSEAWSYGVTLWELATGGAVPFARNAEGTIRRLILSSKATGKLLLDQPPQCPGVLTDVMRACWCGDPRMRPQFIELEVMLEKACESMHRSLQLPTAPLLARADPLVGMSRARQSRGAVRADPLVEPPAPHPVARAPVPSAPPGQPPSSTAMASWEVSELLAKLADMGFARSTAARALTDAHYNVELAASMLLSAERS